ncbi:phosphotransferase [Rhodococcus hoagii]|nr:phosphotransferase [Prescottella equi]
MRGRLGAGCAVRGHRVRRRPRDPHRRRARRTHRLRDRLVRAGLVRVLAALHAVDHRAVGLESFGRPEGYLSRQVALWARQWERVKTRELPDLERLHALLQDAVPSTSRTAIVHGDYRIDNTLVAADDPGRVVAVVDWELSTLGDPLAATSRRCAFIGIVRWT